MVFLNDVDIVKGEKIVRKSYLMEFDGVEFKNGKEIKVGFKANAKHPDVFVEGNICSMSIGEGIKKERTYDYLSSRAGWYYLDDFKIIKDEGRDFYEPEKIKTQMSRVSMQINFDTDNIRLNIYPTRSVFPGTEDRNNAVSVYDSSKRSYFFTHEYDKDSKTIFPIFTFSSGGSSGNDYLYSFGEEDVLYIQSMETRRYPGFLEGDDTAWATLWYESRFKKLDDRNDGIVSRGRIGKWTVLYLFQDLIIDTLSGSPRVNVRENPGTDAKVLFQLTNKTPVKTTAITKESETIDKITDNWVKIKTDDGREGWVFGGYTNRERTVGPKYLLSTNFK